MLSGASTRLQAPLLLTGEIPVSFRLEPADPRDSLWMSRPFNAADGLNPDYSAELLDPREVLTSVFVAGIDPQGGTGMLNRSFLVIELMS